MKEKKGAPRRNLDSYPTPYPSIKPILRHVDKTGVIYEPFCGEGAILAALARDGIPMRRLIGTELNTGRCNTAKYRFNLRQPRHQGARIEQGSSLSGFDRAYREADLIITNPPFTYALEAVQRALALKQEHTEVFMLLRIAFLASQGRYSFMKENTPDLYVLHKRPSFTDDGFTDRYDVGWFAWGPGRTGRIHYL